MLCPVCDGVRMREVEKEGVMIDICPSCKGVWLDRGELEKILESVQEVRQPFNEWYEKQRYEHADDKTGMRHESYDDDRHSGKHYERYDKSCDKDKIRYESYKSCKKKKKRNVFDLLEELFD